MVSQFITNSRHSQAKIIVFICTCSFNWLCFYTYNCVVLANVNIWHDLFISKYFSNYFHHMNQNDFKYFYFLLSLL